MAPASTGATAGTATAAAATATHCPYCALQCAMSLTDATPGGPLVTVAGRQFPTNRGGLCQKGWTSAEVLRAPDRLTSPLLRGEDGVLRPVTWDRALDHVAGRLRALQDAHGQDCVAVFGGGGLTNEKAYQLGKFARVVLRTPYIDYNGRFCMASAAAAANRALGVDRGLPFPLADVGGAQAVLLLGSNLADTMPPATAHLAGARAAGGLGVVDPRHSATAALTDGGQGVHLQPVPGTDVVVLLALLHVLWAEHLVDEAYLDARVVGVETVRRSVALWWPERAEQVCGVPAPDLRRTARLLAAAAPVHGGRGLMVLTGRGVEQSTQGTATVHAAINLARALGLPGRPGRGAGAGPRPVGPGAAPPRRPGRTSPRCGAWIRSPCRELACRRWSCCAGADSRAGCGPCWCTGATCWSAPPTRTACGCGCRPWTSSWAATSCRRRRRSWPTWCCPSRSGRRRRAP